MASHRSINHCSLIFVAVAVLVVGVAALMKLLASGGGGAHEWQLASTIPIRFPNDFNCQLSPIAWECVPNWTQTQQNCTSIPRSRPGDADRAQTLPADLGRPFVAAPNEKGLPAKSRRSRDYMLICVIASAAKVFGYLFNESETHAATVTAGRHQGK